MFCAGDGHLAMVDEIWAFGSFARGAHEPKDIDLAIEFTPDEGYGKHALDCLVNGRDPYTQMRKVLRGRRRGIEFYFERLEMFRREGFDLQLLFRRGDDLQTALGRLRSIRAKRGAGRSPRDSMIPAFEGLENWLIQPVRAGLLDLIDGGAIRVEQVVLNEATVSDPHVVRISDMRWRPNSPFRDAAMAGLQYLVERGHSARRVVIQGKAFRSSTSDGCGQPEPRSPQFDASLARTARPQRLDRGAPFHALAIGRPQRHART